MSTADAANAAAAAAMSHIKTVVVLIQENRSFDHMLGWMKSLNPEIDGVTGQESNPLSTTDPSSKLVHFSDTAEYVDPDPGHSIQAIYEQVYGVPFAAGTTPITPDTPPLMNGFAQQAESEKEGMSETVMNGFRPDAVPVYRELVTSFAVCDRWFASIPTSTQPNRLYVHSATSHGLTSNVTKTLIEGLPQKTIFDSLHEEGHSFGIYYQSPPATLFFRNLRKLKYVGNFHPFDLTFKRHCKRGTLPNYVVVEQRFFDLVAQPANDDHPSHDVSEGQKFVKEVYEALRSSPQWNEMLFIVAYDEHGGFYDHVPTPVGVPSPDGIDGPEPFNFKFDRLGVRVPAIFISPWIEAGTVVHRPSGPYPSSEFEHSSIPATVKKIFNLKNFLTKRDEWAGTIDTVLTRTTPRTDCPVTLPEPQKLRSREAAEEEKLTEFQRELVQMAAVLNGDHARDVVFPHEMIEEMTVAQGSSYVLDAFETFKSACRKHKKRGADADHVVVVNPSQDASFKEQLAPSPSQVLGCFPCGRSS
ncbi:putative non-specific phospholipase C4 [Iris pallida]|uniref:Non-specific phospholipase C4 n=1 Tax=Iris pallida TaxID=29817 RepID=A0AAX6EJY8_IRIPA|nr:putative non-specific phospholipase C4 [Iris pallida]